MLGHRGGFPRRGTVDIWGQIIFCCRVGGWAVLCTVGCLATSLASTQVKCGSVDACGTSQSCQPEMSPDIARCPLGSRVASVEASRKHVEKIHTWEPLLLGLLLTARTEGRRPEVDSTAASRPAVPWKGGRSCGVAEFDGNPGGTPVQPTPEPVRAALVQLPGTLPRPSSAWNHQG